MAGRFVFTNETTARVLADASARECQERLRRKVDRQRLSLQRMPGFAGILSGPSHVFEYVNDAYVALSGPRRFVGRTVREVFPDVEDQGFFELLDRVYATGAPFSGRAMPICLAGGADQRFTEGLDVAVLRWSDSAVTVRACRVA